MQRGSGASHMCSITWILPLAAGVPHTYNSVLDAKLAGLQTQRKEIRSLTPDEWKRYADAVWAFKNGDLGDAYEFPNCARHCAPLSRQAIPHDQQALSSPP